MRGIGVAGVALAAVVMHLAAQVGMLVARPDWTISSFRKFFPIDQLAYMSMVANASQGEFANVEPFTETGANYYPHLYYTVLGAVSGLFGLHPATAWQLGGLTAQAVMVAVLALVLIRLSGRVVVGLLAPVPFILGTFSTFTDGNWFTGYASHAVAWGPFGALFTLNGESVSLCLGSIALLALAAVWLRPTGPRTRFFVTLLAAILIGSLANVQTYSFLAATYLATYIAAGWALTRARKRWWIASAVLLVLVPLAGPIVAGAAGQLPTLVFGLVPAAPGIIRLVIETRGRAAWFLAGAVVGAAPQVFLTVFGIATRDPFLVYRVASNKDLGVPLERGLLAGAAVVIPLILILVAGILHRRAFWVSYPISAGTVWTLLAANDRWGANAEPYRLWIDSYLLVAVTTLVMSVVVIRTLWVERDLPREAVRLRVPRGVVAGGAVFCVLVAGVSAADWVRFYGATDYHGLWSFTTISDKVHASLAEQTDATSDSLLATDPCISPFVVKINTALPIAYYHLGMAWPADRDPLEAYLQMQASGDFEAPIAQAADIGWVLTEQTCAADWPSKFGDELTLVSTQDYVDDAGAPQTAQLWRLNRAGA